MRWLTFAMLAGLGICFQTSVAPHVSVLGCYPDLMLILLVHYTLHARTADGLVAGWLLGLLVDLTSVQMLGVVAGVYGLVALVIWSVRDHMFTKHPLTHFSLTVLSCFAVQVALRWYFAIHFNLDGAGLQIWLTSLFSALYTGLGAVAVHRMLMPFSRRLGLSAPKSEVSVRTSQTNRVRVV